MLQITEGTTNGMTDTCKSVNLPLFQSGVIKHDVISLIAKKKEKNLVKACKVLKPNVSALNFKNCYLLDVS